MARQKSYFHRGGEEPLLGLTIPEHFARIVSRFPESEAVVFCHQNTRLNYSDLSRQIDAVAGGLIGLGLGKGDRVGIWSTNNLQWLLLQMATARIGAILVNINPAYRKHELEYALKRSQVECLFTIPGFKSSDYAGMLHELLPELDSPRRGRLTNAQYPALSHVVIFDPHDPENECRPHPGFTAWPAFIAAGRGVDAVSIDAITETLDADDPINIQYTSGTTGFPKAVLLSHHNILNNAYFTARAMHFSERDRLCAPVPFYHCFGMVLSNLLCISVGASSVIPGEHFEAEDVLRAIELERCTALHGVPTMFIALLEHPEFDRFDLSTLRTGIMAGAPCPPALMTRVMDEMHCREILIGYGETEASPLTHLTTREDSIARRTQTVGRNLPHQEVKIVDPETSRILCLGEIGEICFRGYHVMKGYYGDPEATAKAIDGNGWLHSGDLGTMDHAGYVGITGRLKEMVIRGGENIYPREIEDFIFTHPKVAEVAVFGIPDDYFGEELVAWIQLHAGEKSSEEEIRQYCRDNIAYFKIPKLIRFVDSFPMTVTGKLQKFRMREIMLEALAVEEKAPS
ncbi:MAG: AMP-binding protein [Gammaproteobacteria bacterium]